LQDLANQLESEGICAITRPSLQDPLCQESDSNSPLLHVILDLTRPSLQDSQMGVFDRVPVVTAGYVPHTGGVDPDIFASNPGSVPPSTAGFPTVPFGIGHHFSFFGAANGFS
jgi:hypothetical protein